MIQMQTSLEVADNSGARRVEMIMPIGDKVRIVETRPMSARKRWRVIEIVQKAAK